MKAFSVRHLIFAIVLLAVALPLIFNVALTHSASSDTLRFFDNIDSLPAGSTILISFDFEASAFAEIKPLTESVVKHCFKKNLHVIGLSLFAEGTALGEQVLTRIAGDQGKVYGADYVYLGYRPQYTSAILAIGESITKEFPVDYFGRATAEMSLLDNVNNYRQIAMVVSIADGSMPTYWVDYAVTRFGVSLQIAVTATMATSFYPYLSSGQITGLVAGLKGAAEYELLLGESGSGARGLFAQSISQVVILAVIVAGNVADFVRRRKR